MCLLPEVLLSPKETSRLFSPLRQPISHALTPLLFQLYSHYMLSTWCVEYNWLIWSTHHSNERYRGEVAPWKMFEGWESLQVG
jgi:hypothetical protein